MKLTKIAYAAAIAAISLPVFISCSGNEEGGNTAVRPLSDYKNLTAGDSVAYYFGQLQSLDYWNMARQDTLMVSRESRDQYLKGLRAGYDAVRDNEAYNRGYYMGVQMAMQMKEFSEEYGTTADKQILFDAFEDGLVNDSIVNASDAQMGFTQVNASLNARKEAADKAKAIEALKNEAASKKLTMINDVLYATAPQGGEGALLKDGETVSVSLNVFNAHGSEIDRREDGEVIVGRTFPGPVTAALLSMKVGETRTFHTYAQALFGRMFRRYGLEPTDIVSFRITTAKAEPKAKESNEPED